MLRQRLSRDARVVDLVSRARGLVGPVPSRSHHGALLIPGPCDVPWLQHMAPSSDKASLDHSQIMSTAIDAFYLAHLLEEPSLAQMGTDGLGWITGLHQGIPGHMVDNPPSSAPIESAAFIHGLDARRVRSTRAWWWPRGALYARLDPLLRLIGLESEVTDTPPTEFMSVFSGADEPQDVSQVGETSMKNDGLWLYAACMHGDCFA